MIPSRFVIGLLLLLVSLSHVRLARGDTGDSVAAESLFNEGRDFLNQGRLEEACDRFARSKDLDPSVGTLLNLGACYSRRGMTASAWGAYREATVLATTRRDERAEVARQSASQLEPRLARLTILIEKPVAGLSITRNGSQVAASLYATAIPIDPGPQVLVATAPDHQSWRSSAVDVREGGSITMRVPSLAPTALWTSPSPWKPVPVALEIGGGCLTVAGLILGGLAISKWSSVTDTCPEGHCADQATRDRLAGDADSASTLATLSTVSIVAGLAALTTGVVLHLAAPKNGKPDERQSSKQ